MPAIYSSPVARAPLSLVHDDHDNIQWGRSVEWQLRGSAAWRDHRAACRYTVAGMRATPIYDELVEAGHAAPTGRDTGARPDTTGCAHVGTGRVAIHRGTPGRHREPVPEARVQTLR
jgi:hypothetical protein